jgi:hypothetical protein
MFWKKRKKEQPTDNVILGMVLLQDAQSFSLDNALQDLRKHYDIAISETTGDDAVAVFDVDGQMVALSFLPVPVPGGDIEGTTRSAYNWPTAVDELKEHKGHIIVSILRGNGSPVKRFSVFTQVICSLLRTTNAIGVYKGNQSLLIPKDDYLEQAEALKDDILPLNLWVYVGLRQAGGRNSGYTYGMKEFGKTEMEILNSGNGLGEIRGFLLGMAHYVLKSDVEFKDGETCGFSAEERIKITYSKGQFVEGYTLKLAY